MSSRRARDVLFAAAYLAMYALFLVALALHEHFAIAEPLLVLAVIGGGFSGIAWLLTRGVEPLPVDAPRIAPAVAYLIVIAAFVTFAFEYLPSTQPLQDVVRAAEKLIVFVAIPALLFRTRIRWSWTPRLTAVAVTMAAVLIVFQVVFGSGPRRISEAGLTAGQITIAALGAMVWMSIEAGLVEEFFFRATLQTRLEQFTRSTVGGIVVTALLFGLVHSPGLYLRSTRTHEALGAHPSLLLAVGYSIVVLSPTGFFLGILWWRTRNLLLVVLVHGAADLVPNLVDFARNFHIA